VLVPKLAMLYLSGVFLWYNFKYNSVTWESKGGFKMVTTQGALLPVSSRLVEFFFFVCGEACFYRLDFRLRAIKFQWP
jgi:hypothetical protein